MCRFWMLILSISAGNLHAEGGIEVSVCNFANLEESRVIAAERETAFVFRSIHIDVVWLACAAPPSGSGGNHPHRFAIRLRPELPRRYVPEVSLHAMGRAFVSDSGEGYLADVYYPAVHAFAQTSPGSEYSLIGYTMAHELGHLLLGPGHRRTGIMSARWGSRETFAISKEWLKFDPRDATLMRRRLKELGQR